jgi:uncharacterized protein with ATP-grasp and redox domains
MLPELPPEYLCNEAGSFAANTLRVRLPEIAQRMLAENNFPTFVHDRMEQLLVEMREGRVRPLNDPGAPDAVDWEGYLKPHLGKRWCDLSFFVCENIFYRRILEACGYFQYGLENGLDPYLAQKTLGLETSRAALMSLARRLENWERQPDEKTLGAALESNLWGNRADLSLWPAGAEGTLSNEALHQAEEFMLVNELPRLTAFLSNLRGGRIEFLIDNAGFELACDLATADLFLSSGIAREVHFQVKFHPTFVSDAMEADVRRTALFLSDFDECPARSFGLRLIDHLAEGRLILHPGRFWNSPLPGWEMPAAVRNELAQADLVISKGDANFRRLTGDRHWEPTASFSAVCAYFPTRLAALRVDKSEVALNLFPGQAAILDQQDSDWRTNGRWGMIQFA